jgi:Family of unknown function (DUF5683)
MGPGGPRGLQILRLGAFRVRGGFDSHTFPPLLALALALAPGAVPGANGDAHAQAAEPFVVVDSVVVADSSGVVTTGTPPSPRGGVRRPEEPSGILSEPRWVMMRSLVFPGWGQAYNGQWVKAALVAGTEGYLILRIIDDQRDLDDLEAAAEAARAAADEEAEDLAVSAYNDRLDAFVRRQWFLGAVIVYALVDAYVDAHFRNFDVDFENDPALPGGTPGGPGGRLSLRWRF